MTNVPDPGLNDVNVNGRGLLLCNQCGFWFIEHGTQVHVGARIAYVAGKLMEYPEQSAQVPIQALMSHIKKQPNRLYHLNPTALEKLVAECFRLNEDYVEVIHVGRPGDGGVDVLLIDRLKGKILVEIKRRTKPGTEPVATIRNLLGAMVANDALEGIVVSTADHFSHRAYELSKRISRSARGYRIQLRDIGVLRQMIAEAPQMENPWQRYLSSPQADEYHPSWRIPTGLEDSA
jgi:restriction endonuclease Mrr